MVDMTKSLKQLGAIPDLFTGGEDWPSALVPTCKHLYEKPLKDFTTEGLSDDESRDSRVTGSGVQIVIQRRTY